MPNILKTAKPLLILAIFYYTCLKSIAPDSLSWWMRAVFAGPIFLYVILMLLKFPSASTHLDKVAALFKNITITRRQWLVFISAAMLLFSSLLVYFIFGTLPVNPDGYAYFIQGKIFASGHLYKQSGPFPDFFTTQWMLNDGKYYSKYPPGYSLALAAFRQIGITWLANPIMGVLAILAIYFLTEEIAGERTARIASLLTLLSSSLVLLSAQYWNHVFALACALGFAYFYIKMHRNRRWADAFIAGTLLGVTFITRPQLAIPFGIPFALHYLTSFRKAHFVPCAIAGLVAFSFWIGFFLYNDAQTTGDPFLTPYAKYHVDSAKVVFNNWYDDTAVTKQWDRMLFSMNNLHRVLFAWPISSLWFVCLLFLLELQIPYCGLLISAAGMVALSLVLIPYTGGLPYARYLSEASGLCIVLSAICIEKLPQWLHRHCQNTTLTSARCMVYAATAFLFIFGMCDQFSGMFHHFKYYAHTNYMWGANPPYRDEIESLVKKPALVFFVSNSYYYTGSVFNPPDDGAPIIAARDYGERNKELMQLYPNRFVYLAMPTGIQSMRDPLNDH